CWRAASPPQTTARQPRQAPPGAVGSWRLLNRPLAGIRPDTQGSNPAVKWFVKRPAMRGRQAVKRLKCSQYNAPARAGQVIWRKFKLPGELHSGSNLQQPLALLLRRITGPRQPCQLIWVAHGVHMRDARL